MCSSHPNTEQWVGCLEHERDVEVTTRGLHPDISSPIAFHPLERLLPRQPMFLIGGGRSAFFLPSMDRSQLSPRNEAFLRPLFQEMVRWIGTWQLFLPVTLFAPQDRYGLKTPRFPISAGQRKNPSSACKVWHILARAGFRPLLCGSRCHMVSFPLSSTWPPNTESVPPYNRD